MLVVPKMERGKVVMANTGILVRPCDVIVAFGLKGEESLAWSTMLGFLKDPKERSLCMPDIFVCPDCYTHLAPADGNVVLCLIQDQVQFVHSDAVCKIPGALVWGPDSELEKWKQLIVSYCRGHLQHRNDLVAGANRGLVATRPAPRKETPKQFEEYPALRPRPGRRGSLSFVG